jgi:hypothetical protein
MNKIYDIRNLQITKDSISFELSANIIDIPLNKTGSAVLPQAKPEYLKIFEIDQDGIGIYWPLLDEDLSVEGLLRAAGRDDLIVKDIPSLYIEEISEYGSINHNVQEVLA